MTRAEINRRWREKHPEKMREIRRKEYLKRQAYYQEKSRKWREADRERYNESQKNCYRMRKLKVNVADHEKLYLNNNYPTCANCGRKYLRRLRCLWCTDYTNRVNKK